MLDVGLGGGWREGGSGRGGLSARVSLEFWKVRSEVGVRFFLGRGYSQIGQVDLRPDGAKERGNIGWVWRDLRQSLTLTPHLTHANTTTRKSRTKMGAAVFKSRGRNWS